MYSMYIHRYIDKRMWFFPFYTSAMSIAQQGYLFLAVAHTNLPTTVVLKQLYWRRSSQLLRTDRCALAPGQLNPLAEGGTHVS